MQPVDCICRWALLAIVRGMKPTEIVNNKAIGERVKFRRQDIGMSQERLAEILDVSYQQIQRYESGRNRLSVETIQVIAHALGVPITFFFNPPSESASLPEPPDEKVLLKHFRQIESNPDRQAVVLVARRLAAAKR